MSSSIPRTQSTCEAIETRHIRWAPHPHRRDHGGYRSNKRLNIDNRNSEFALEFPPSIFLSLPSLQFAKSRVPQPQLMDSMDWFNPTETAAQEQILALNKVLKLGGRVFFRSAALRPWYTDIFERNGFEAKCVGRRDPGKCIDR